MEVNSIAARSHAVHFARFVVARRLVPLFVRFFARRNDFPGRRPVKERDATAINGEDGGDGEAAV